MTGDGRKEDAACERFLAMLAEHAAAGEGLPGDGELAAHLAACASCRADFDAMRRARELLARPDAESAPGGLAERTARRAAQAAKEPVSAGTAQAAGARFSIFLRPIRHPAARIAAAAAILLSMMPMAWLDLAERIGGWQRCVMGENLARRIDPVGEKILDLYGGIGISDAEVARLSGAPLPEKKT